jgi:hypothetical protein
MISVEAGVAVASSSWDIDKTQFSLLVTVVVLSAIVPTAIAQAFFSPIAHLEEEAAIPAEEYV